MGKGRISISKHIKFAIIGLITGIANGLFGSGGGTIAVPAMVLLLKEEEHVAHATAISIILPLTLVSAFIYVSNSYIDWSLTIKTMLGGIVGGYLGAKLLNICPTRILRKIFAVFIIAAAVRMII
ncbi:MAG TPA: sulfite exporter TauE/SafE family protein [Acetivibrio sp.]|mgnify:CR=1 FL=1|uniref:sulfite exporter TauE/SafE family protein n=1 Tax=Acetivibrio sp. TaxID=1872092 RepID=UPI002C0411B3|nr:sulfite exporter TauE/SafE family protein [Acetivibrio sp.]HOM01674.1 sulfite exporter TauE/SafE family protein [Acetivibrio sp.]